MLLSDDRVPVDYDDVICVDCALSVAVSEAYVDSGVAGDSDASADYGLVDDCASVDLDFWYEYCGSYECVSGNLYAE